MIVVIVWLCLVTVGNHVHGTVITISNSGTNSTMCCINGTCACSSLYNALASIENNTVINITSKVVLLHTMVYMKSGNLKHNITITSEEGAMVMCDNTGVYFVNFVVMLLLKQSDGIVALLPIQICQQSLFIWLLMFL